MKLSRFAGVFLFLAIFFTFSHTIAVAEIPTGTTGLIITADEREGEDQYYYNIEGYVTAANFDKDGYDSEWQDYNVVIDSVTYNVKEEGWGTVVTDASGEYALQITARLPLSYSGNKQVKFWVNKLVGDQTFTVYNYDFSYARQLMDANADPDVELPALPDEFEPEEPLPGEEGEPVCVAPMACAVNEINIDPVGMTADGKYIYEVSGVISKTEWEKPGDVGIMLVDPASGGILGGPYYLKDFGAGDFTYDEFGNVVFSKKLALVAEGVVDVVFVNTDGGSSDQFYTSQVNFASLRTTIATSGTIVAAPPAIGGGSIGSSPYSPVTVSINCADWRAVSGAGDKAGEAIAKCVGDWGAQVNIFFIGIGVIGSLILLPIVGAMWASGNPGNVEKGWEIFNSWFWGLMLLLLSGFIINIFAKDLFGVS